MSHSVRRWCKSRTTFVLSRLGSTVPSVARMVLALRKVSSSKRTDGRWRHARIITSADMPNGLAPGGVQVPCAFRSSSSSFGARGLAEVARFCCLRRVCKYSSSCTSLISCHIISRAATVLSPSSAARSTGGLLSKPASRRSCSRRVAPTAPVCACTDLTTSCVSSARSIP